MSEIKRFDIPRNGNEFLHEDPDGEYVQYDDHLAEVLRMRAEVRRLTGDLSYTIDRCRALELSIEQADELKAHAEAAAAAEEAETDRVTAERDAAQAEVERLRAERDQTATHPKGREVGRFGLDGHYLAAMEPTRLIDEDIWREAFMTLLPSFPWEKAAEKSDCVLVEYRKRWPR